MTPSEQKEKFFNEKAEIILELLLPSSKEFNQYHHLAVFLVSYDLYTKQLISIYELAGIGSMLQKRLPIDKSIEAFSDKDIFDIFEMANTLIFYISQNQIAENDLKTLENKFIESTKQLYQKYHKNIKQLCQPTHDCKK